MVAVKNDSDIGGGTAEQSFSKSDIASTEYASISFWQITDVLSKCNLRSQRTERMRRTIPNQTSRLHWRNTVSVWLSLL